MDHELRTRLEQFIEHHLRDGTTMSVEVLCSDRPEFAAPLAALVARYLAASRALDPDAGILLPAADPLDALPAFDGFRTIERIGSGGMG